MQQALNLARGAAEAGEAPIGALIVDETSGQILAESFNAPVRLCDPTAHAEILALRKAGEVSGNYRLSGLTLVCTLEPCAMCAGAISHARIGRLIFAASDPKGGAVLHGPRLFEQPTLHARPIVEHGLMAQEAGDLLRAFFRARR